MARVLEMIFVTEEGKSATIAVENPKEPVDANTVKSAMEQMIAGNAFVSSSGDFVSIKGARLVERNVEDVELI
ncbi:DUF2922 domain-containing protein [Peribacillus butanolivorans]|uniref:DUF2922 domain-containing protein n=1 Tax=Peribacillus butanolivorans TaxID=421767 RepID=UPI00070F9A0A|nr:DUF2922 domain-containing protein [Peribacillus butanolivorans]KRF51233.1 hypothetical protein ASG99_12925 [Bacillus sp. Soil768D1]MCO0597797.1 DUF2922 domain-containing protein [Peribacillus butanolivorans]